MTESIGNERLLDLAYDLAPFLRLCATGADESRILERAGLTALIAPGCADRSLINSVAFDRRWPEALIDALDDLSLLYADAGVNAWGVWALDGEQAVEAALANAGFTLDSEPFAMAAPIDEIRLDREASAETEIRWDPVALARINARAYGFPDEELISVLAGMPAGDDVFTVFAVDDGEPTACAMMARLPNNDCAVYFVATDPDRRGRGLGHAVMGAGLRLARARGCETTSLQSSAPGYGLYRKLGYRDLGRRVNLWERREPVA